MCAMPIGRSSAFSAAMAEADRAIKGFLYPRMYRHPRVMRIMGDAEARGLRPCSRATATPADMPAEWAQTVEAGDEADAAAPVADFIAGMTDRYALIEHARLFDSTPELR